MHNIPAVIFAGGKSSRMGTDKSLLPFQDYKTMTEYQYAKLQKYFDTVYISTKENKFDFDCKLILDTKEASSPLVALVSVFEQLKVESVFVLSVDAPLVDNVIIDKLFKHDENSHDAIIAKSPKGLQPLCGIYHRSILPYAISALAQDNHKLMSLLSPLQVCEVPFTDERPFTNLNHKEEYEALLRRKF